MPCICVRMYVPSNDDFQIWLHQKVWYNNDCKCTRKDILPEIVEDLTAWLKRKGYIMDSRWSSQAFAKWLYAIHVQEIARGDFGKAIGYPEIHHRNWPEDHEYFENIITTDEIIQFLDKWRLSSDFSQDSELFGRIVSEIPDILYNYIDLNTSKQGIFIANIFGHGSSDSDDDNANGVQDIYVVEANQGLHGGRGQKV